MVFQTTRPVAAFLIKPYLKKLTLSVHPDFFHGDKIKKQHNAEFLQQLYTILDPILRPATASTTTASVDPIQLNFYNKLGNEVLKPKTQRRKQIPRPTKTQDVVFSDPKQTWSTVDSSSLFADNSTSLSYRLIRMQKPHISLTQEFANAFYKEQQQPQRPQQQQQQQQWSRSCIMDQKLFMWDPQLDSNHVMDKFSEWLPHLHPEQWWGKLPTLFLSAQMPPPSGQLAKGILILDDSMTMEDMNKYIQQHLKIKMKEYQDPQ
ncbi:unnamed protein product [Absidia cylindrospora]